MVVFIGTDNNGRSFLDGALIGKGERDRDNITEFISCHIRHPLGHPRFF